MSRGCVKLASVTDGTSNTLMYSERAHGMLNATDQVCWNWWCSAISVIPALPMYYPSIRSGEMPTPRGSARSAAVSVRRLGLELPPRGANFLFCDGSVRFLKDSINCWAINPATNLPNGVTLDSAGFVYQIATVCSSASTRRSTKAGGEVISSAMPIDRAADLP